jgi:hypothetical protein
MKTRYRLTCRGSRGRKYYCVDTQNGKRTSLQTGNEEEVRQLIEAHKATWRTSRRRVSPSANSFTSADAGALRMASWSNHSSGSTR